MTHLTAPLAAHHKLCDEEFAVAEQAASQGDVAGCRVAFHRLHQELEAHFAVEEASLFPAFEQQTGMTGGPTQVMRLEHSQMRGLLDDMAASLVSGETDEYLGLADTLLVLMQQHNLKEENILYPMCSQALAGRADLSQALVAGIQSGHLAEV